LFLHKVSEANGKFLRPQGLPSVWWGRHGPRRSFRLDRPAGGARWGRGRSTAAAPGPSPRRTARRPRCRHSEVGEGGCWVRQNLLTVTEQPSSFPSKRTLARTLAEGKLSPINQTRLINQAHQRQPNNSESYVLPSKGHFFDRCSNCLRPLKRPPPPNGRAPWSCRAHA